MSEWLGKIDATTTLEDVISRPSAFNPYPEHASQGMEVWNISNPTSNPLYTIRYPKIDAGCRVELPISHAVDQPHEKPKLLAGSALNGDYRHVAVADPEGWSMIENFWQGLSLDLASDYLRNKGRKQGALQETAEIAAAANGKENAAGYTIPDPRTFVRLTIDAAQKHIKNGTPEIAYNLAESMFWGRSSSKTSPKFSTEEVREWTKDAMSRLLFPNFADAWTKKLDPETISTMAHPYEIGSGAARVASTNLSSAAIKAWLSLNHENVPQAVSDKIAKLDVSFEKRIVATEVRLDVMLEQARREFPEATHDAEGYLTWEPPYPFGKYILGVLSSLD